METLWLHRDLRWEIAETLAHYLFFLLYSISVLPDICNPSEFMDFAVLGFLFLYQTHLNMLSSDGMQQTRWDKSVVSSKMAGLTSRTLNWT